MTALRGTRGGGFAVITLLAGLLAIPLIVVPGSGARARDVGAGRRRAAENAASKTQSYTANLTVAIKGGLHRVPASFLGLSVEYNELPEYERRLVPFARMVDALRPPGARSAVVLRVGGESADSSFWGRHPWKVVARPYRQGHAYKLNATWMKTVAALARDARLKLILDLNLAAHSPKMAAEVAAEARRDLPARSVSDFEIGNEPDLYRLSYVGYTRARRGGPNKWAFHFTVRDYDYLFGAYARTVRRVFSRARFAGPSGVSRSPAFVSDFLSSAEERNASMVTAHLYPPFAGCVPPSDPKYPRPRAYLTDAVAAGVASEERLIVAAAHAARLPVRLTEVGSSVCGGVAGRTDSFATALWIPDMLFNLVTVGVEGVNIHLRANRFLNSALAYRRTGVYAEPLFYGMVVFARSLGPGARVMRVSRSTGAEQLKVWAVRLRDHSLRVLYINKSPLATYVRLSSASRKHAYVQRLIAPSLRANRTVSVAGQRLGTDGRWHGTRRQLRISTRHGAYRVLVPAFSATLLSMPG